MLVLESCVFEGIFETFSTHLVCTCGHMCSQTVLFVHVRLDLGLVEKIASTDKLLAAVLWILTTLWS